MKKIPLTKGKYAIVDDEDYPYLSRFRWHTMSIKGKNYSYDIPATTLRTLRGETYQMLMRRLIIPERENLRVVHKNHDELDCRKENLVYTNTSLKVNNARKIKGTYSDHKGVSLDIQQVKRGHSKKWRCSIMKDNKSHFLGYYEDENEAALAYNEKAKELYGEHAYQNKIEPEKQKEEIK